VSVTELLDLPAESAAMLAEIPLRGAFDALPPADPTIYRLYEAPGVRASAEGAAP
jgi:cyanate lyase